MQENPLGSELLRRQRWEQPLLGQGFDTIHKIGNQCEGGVEILHACACTKLSVCYILVANIIMDVHGYGEIHNFHMTGHMTN